MGSQFVDFNADGHVDFLTATFDGSPHVSYGNEEGFGKPEIVRDASGERVIISHIWNHEKNRHEVVGRAMGTDKPRSERCISALAFDWDADGDFDLLLGSYENGRLYLQMNEGTKTKPKFTGKNLPVMAGDVPFALPAKMTAPRLVDWDRDGDLDIVTGSFGDGYSNGPGGAVYLSLNTGKKGAPAFGPLVELIRPGKKGGPELTEPHAGLYPEVVDYDGDGDLDLLVGGYSMWKPVGRTLSAEEQATVAKLRKRQAGVRKERAQIYKKIAAETEVATKGLERDSEAYRIARSNVRSKHLDKIRALNEKYSETTAALDKLVPSAKREAFVWLYERK